VARKGPARRTPPTLTSGSDRSTARLRKPQRAAALRPRCILLSIRLRAAMHWLRIARAPQARWRVFEIESAGVESERMERAADFGPVEYLSKLLGIDRQTAMRWFIVLVACLLDRAAVMLLVAATVRQSAGHQ
jgi:hypothetical protein